MKFQKFQQISRKFSGIWKLCETLLLKFHEISLKFHVLSKCLKFPNTTGPHRCASNNLFGVKSWYLPCLNLNQNSQKGIILILLLILHSDKCRGSCGGWKIHTNNISKRDHSNNGTISVISLGAIHILRHTHHGLPC